MKACIEKIVTRLVTTLAGEPERRLSDYQEIVGSSIKDTSKMRVLMAAGKGYLVRIELEAALSYIQTNLCQGKSESSFVYNNGYLYCTTPTGGYVIPGHLLELEGDIYLIHTHSEGLIPEKKSFKEFKKMAKETEEGELMREYLHEQEMLPLKQAKIRETLPFPHATELEIMEAQSHYFKQHDRRPPMYVIVTAKEGAQHCLPKKQSDVMDYAKEVQTYVGEGDFDKNPCSSFVKLKCVGAFVDR